MAPSKVPFFLAVLVLAAIGCGNSEPTPEEFTITSGLSANEIGRVCRNGTFSIRVLFVLPGAGELSVVLLVDGEEKAREAIQNADEEQTVTLECSDLSAGAHDFLVRWEDADGKQVGKMGPATVRCR